MDRDLVHRQTACAVVQHMSLGVAGLGCEDALTHLLNYVFPNIFEVSPHIIQARRDGWRGGAGWRRVRCGPGRRDGRGNEQAQAASSCWPAALCSSPPCVQTTTGAIDGCRVALGPAVILNYLLQVGAATQQP